MGCSEIHSGERQQSKRVHTEVVMVDHLFEALEPLLHVRDILDLVLFEHQCHPVESNPRDENVRDRGKRLFLPSGKVVGTCEHP